MFSIGSRVWSKVDGVSGVVKAVINYPHGRREYCVEYGASGVVRWHDEGQVEAAA